MGPCDFTQWRARGVDGDEMGPGLPEEAYKIGKDIVDQFAWVQVGGRAKSLQPIEQPISARDLEGVDAYLMKVRASRKVRPSFEESSS